MGRGRKETCFFGTIFAALSGGTTVRRTTTWTGKKKTIVPHWGSGKTKEYTHNDGFFGNKTTTKTTKNGRVVERGEVRKGFFGGTYETAKKVDGTKVERNFRSGIFTDYVSTKQSGTCHACDGKGTFSKACRACRGDGQFAVAGKHCANCAGTGSLIDGRVCPGCHGDGWWMKPSKSTCRACDGSGIHIETCRKCTGSGLYHYSR